MQFWDLTGYRNSTVLAGQARALGLEDLGLPGVSCDTWGHVNSPLSMRLPATGAKHTFFMELL